MACAPRPRDLTDRATDLADEAVASRPAGVSLYDHLADLLVADQGPDAAVLADEAARDAIWILADDCSRDRFAP